MAIFKVLDCWYRICYRNGIYNFVSKYYDDTIRYMYINDFKMLGHILESETKTSAEVESDLGQLIGFFGLDGT